MIGDLCQSLESINIETKAIEEDRNDIGGQENEAQPNNIR